MKGGVIDREINPCLCGGKSELIWHFINGTPNRVHYFVRCEKCRVRTRNRRNIEGAVEEWSNLQALECIQTI